MRDVISILGIIAILLQCAFLVRDAQHMHGKYKAAPRLEAHNTAVASHSTKAGRVNGTSMTVGFGREEGGRKFMHSAVLVREAGIVQSIPRAGNLKQFGSRKLGLGRDAQEVSESIPLEVRGQTIDDALFLTAHDDQLHEQSETSWDSSAKARAQKSLPSNDELLWDDATQAWIPLQSTQTKGGVAELSRREREEAKNAAVITAKGVEAGWWDRVAVKDRIFPGQLSVADLQRDLVVKDPSRFARMGSARGATRNETLRLQEEKRHNTFVQQVYANALEHGMQDVDANFTHSLVDKAIRDGRAITDVRSRDTRPILDVIPRESRRKYRERAQEFEASLHHRGHASQQVVNM